jgi:homocysteine S-methyltransferase
MSGTRQTFVGALRRAGPIIIDGGLGTQLEAQGENIHSEVWSAVILKSNPQAIVNAHRSYLDAGAECIITASYQASHQGFASLGFGEEEADRLILSATALAKQACAEFLQDNPECTKKPLVAASVGPYAAVLHNGSEYTGDYGVSTDEILRFHRDRLQLLDRSGGDVLACETIPSLVEAQVLCGLLSKVETPAWICFSCCDGEHLSDGTPIKQVVGLFRDHPRVLAVGVNCTSPQFIAPLIREIRAVVPDKAVVVYPNSGERYISSTNSWIGTATPIECGTAAKAWVAAGAKFVGGCCRMGPAHIREMREALATSDTSDSRSG